MSAELDRGELALATTYFETAVRNGSPFEAYYYLGEMHSAQASNIHVPSHIASSSCAMAVSFYKLVAERGVWDDDLLRDAEIAWMSATDQGKELAMLQWWIAAERGYEIAQNNLAYVLDQGMLCTYFFYPCHSHVFLRISILRQKYIAPDKILTDNNLS